MSSAQSQAGGFVIMSQVTPQDNSRPRNEKEQRNEPLSDKSLSKFFKGEPEVLGVTQIFVGFLHIGFGISLHHLCNRRCSPLDIIVYSSVALWSGIMYLISGSLSVTAANKPTKIMVKASFIANLLSAVLSGIAALIFIVFLFETPYYTRGYSRPNIYCYYFDPLEECKGNFHIKHAEVGTVVILFLHTLLEFSISLSMSIFGCKTVCRTSESEVAVVIYQNTSLNVGVPADLGAITHSSDRQ